ncbi:MAG TPA: bifunctional phosphoribosylaminoimidazolecarboxamide formyltransferase/IMP cyclohydrolase [bacterium]|nr:bifunctional phosphoribosylaminoimidazolecarboxamide formyltransferase/IMP cyclohydrolase [bacterium]
MKRVERALISVTDKKGIVEFAKGLHELDIEIVSTGGTAALLKEAGLPVVSIADFTGFPEMLDGRVKTLHPKVHGGILAKRDDEKHVREMEKHGIQPIDMVVINLYPFEQTIAKPNVPFDEVIENIDIGGPSMIRSAAKNYKDVAVVVNPSKYEPVLNELKKNDCRLSEELKFRLAVEAFKTTSSYDTVIYNYLKGMMSLPMPDFSQDYHVAYRKAQDLRYGENPHQKAAFYKELGCKEPCAATAAQLHGKELSFNNIYDIDAAVELVKEFTEPAAVIIKHTNPCGAAAGGTLLEAYEKAIATDPVSAFGGIYGFNRRVDIALARAVTEEFVEVIAAPGYDDDALAELKKKKNLRIMAIEGLEGWIAKVEKPHYGKDIKRVVGGILVQERDTVLVEQELLRVVTERRPSPSEMKSLMFAWAVCKHVRSNAIVLARECETVGIGAGQMSRVDSVKLAITKAAKEVSGAVLASDAFFPFRDSIDQIAKSGIRAVIQPGGSVKDQEVIKACNEHGIAMVFTGVRHFKH